MSADKKKQTTKRGLALIKTFSRQAIVELDWKQRIANHVGGMKSNFL